MALQVHDTIRLDTTLSSNMPVAEYKVDFSGWSDINRAAVVTERALDGQLHVHRTTTAGGDVFRTRDYRYQLILTHAEYLTLRAKLGEIMYFMPHYRNESAPLSYRFVVTFEQMLEDGMREPTMLYFKSTIHLTDSDGLTVD